MELQFEWEDRAPRPGSLPAVCVCVDRCSGISLHEGWPRALHHWCPWKLELSGPPGPAGSGQHIPRCPHDARANEHLRSTSMVCGAMQEAMSVCQGGLATWLHQPPHSLAWLLLPTMFFLTQTGRNWNRANRIVLFPNLSFYFSFEPCSYDTAYSLESNIWNKTIGSYYLRVKFKSWVSTLWKRIMSVYQPFCCSVWRLHGRRCWSSAHSWAKATQCWRAVRWQRARLCVRMSAGLWAVWPGETISGFR